MLTFNQSVLDRRIVITDTHSTYPFEGGWAGKAAFFIQTEGAHPALQLQPEISPDGINWVPIESASEMPSGARIAVVDLENFAGWLRLTVTGATIAEPATVLIHLALKG